MTLSHIAMQFSYVEQPFSASLAQAFMFLIQSSIYYFNKRGWFFDKKRDEIN